MKTCIIGAGPAGLAAGFRLTKKNKKVIVLEKEKLVGGLAKTINWNGFRFDLGGHRFFTKNKEINSFVNNLMKNEMIEVNRISRIYLNGKFFDYPLKPQNALLNTGLSTTVKASIDYIIVKLSFWRRMHEEKTFEDWISNRFGYTLYKLFFKEYTEKVWGIPCKKIAAIWASQRIKGMSLTSVVKNALFKASGPKSLIDKFTYPKYGIGRICERMKEEIMKKNKVLVNSSVIKIISNKDKIVSVETKNHKKIIADNFISTMPITALILNMHPKAPQEVIDAAKRLTYRDWMAINFITKNKRFSKDTWIYVQNKSISFGRIQQWANWSESMLYKNKGSVMVEFFVTEGDEYWNMDDQKLINIAKIDICQKLKLLKEEELIDGTVIRIKKAYPVYRVGYEKHLKIIKDYLKRFGNLTIIGRYGTFRYNNIDHALEAGLKSAENLMGANHDLEIINADDEYLEEKKRNK